MYRNEMRVLLITFYSTIVPFLHILPNIHIVKLETEDFLFDIFYSYPDQPDINHVPYRIVPLAFILPLTCSLLSDLRGPHLVPTPGW